MKLRKVVHRGRRLLKEHNMNPKTVVQDMKARRESKAKHRSLEKDWGCITSNAIARGEHVSFKNSSASDTKPRSYAEPKPATPPPPYIGDEITTNEGDALDKRDAWIREACTSYPSPSAATDLIEALEFNYPTLESILALQLPREPGERISTVVPNANEREFLRVAQEGGCNGVAWHIITKIRADAMKQIWSNWRCQSCYFGGVYPDLDLERGNCCCPSEMEL